MWSTENQARIGYRVAKQQITWDPEADHRIKQVLPDAPLYTQRIETRSPRAAAPTNADVDEAPGCTAEYPSVTAPPP